MSAPPNPKIRFGITAKLFLVVLVAYGFLVSILVLQVNQEANRASSATIEKSLSDARTVLETRLAGRFDNIEETCGNLARDGLLRPFVYARDGATLQDQCGEFAQSLDFDILIFTDAEGEILAKSDDPDAAGAFVGGSPLFQRALQGEASRGIMRKGATLLQIVALPIFDNTAPDLVRGSVALAYELSPALMAEIRSLTGSEVALYAFVPDPDQPDNDLAKEVSNTLSHDGASLADQFATNPELPERIREAAVPLETEIVLGEETYDAMVRPLQSSSGSPVGFVIALRSRTELLAPYHAIERRAIQVGLVCFVLATLLSLVIAKRITGPIIDLVAVARAIQDGDYPKTAATKRSDEIGVLMNAVHDMGRELKEKAEMEDYLAGLSDDMDAQLTSHFTTHGALDMDDVETQSMTPNPRANNVLTAFPLGSTVNERYRLIQILGAGAMGVVYLAQDIGLGEPVALKFINSPRMTAPVFEQLKQEIRLARRITHRNVLRTHDFGTAKSLHFITMEVLQGYDLATLVSKLGPLEFKLGILLARQICSGVAAAHEEGVIHRDLKPQNVMINRNGILKIMDFGVAVQNEPIDGSGTSTPEGFERNAVVGTPDYMSPEQFSGQDVDERSDVYSLGIVAYYMFSAQLPYTGNSVWELATKHIGEETPLLRQVRPDAPQALEAVIARAMATDPASRFASAIEFGEALAGVRLD